MTFAPSLTIIIHAMLIAQVPTTEEPFLEAYAKTGGFRLGSPSRITPTPDDRAVLFLRTGPRNFVGNIYEFDVATKSTKVLLTAEQVLGGVAEKLSVEELARRERMRSSARGIASFDLSKDGSKILIGLSGTLYVVERSTGTIKKLASRPGFPIDPRFSPDGNKIAYVIDGDLYVLDIPSNKETALTQGAAGTISRGLAEFVAQEEMNRFAGFWWSPDSQQLCYQETDVAGLETFSIADPAHPEREPTRFPYPRVGKANAKVKLGLIAAVGGSTTWLDLASKGFEYVAHVSWQENAPLVVLLQNRLQSEEVLYAVDATTGKMSELLREKDNAWLNLDSSVPHWLEDGSGFLWSTERNGAWELELREPTGKLVRVVVPAAVGYRGIAHVHGKNVIVQASPDPTESHLYRIDLEKPEAGVTQLTMAPGLHGCSYSKSGKLRVESFSGLSPVTPPRVVDDQGNEIGSLPSVAEKPPFDATVEFTTVGKERKFHASIVRPTKFEQGKKYPVLVSVYAGPHTTVVRKASRAYLKQQYEADQGFIVVSLDGRGTPYRGRDWERSTHLDFSSIPLDDQVAGLQGLLEKYPEMDGSRVGIFGWSFGGYFSAMAVMRRPDIYHAGIAGAPVADFRDYDTHYTERYLGLPTENQVGYDKCSVTTYAKDLSRPLLVVHGTADDNVYFLHGIKIADTLFRARKEFEFLPLAGMTHMVSEPSALRALEDRQLDFFKRHLQTPRAIAP